MQHVKIFVGVLIIILNCFSIPYVELNRPNIVVADSLHYSEVLGEYRHYRIFLPTDYHKNPDKNYPTVYFYHGWSERYFGSLKKELDPSGQISPEEEAMQRMVEKYSFIVVQPDGYNADPADPYYLRPYNIGPVETYRQFPLYFPELTAFIDKNYRTIPERNKRSIAGFSMGGFMAYWIAGKYPDMVCAAGSFCGSPEFVVGPKNFPVEYYHGNMYENYEGVRLRLNYGEEDFIRAYHKDLEKIFEHTLRHFEIESYPGKHSRVGLDDMFDFFDRSFQNPPEPLREWDHIDVYPDFEVWDYHISTDRDVPGFTVIQDVGPQGFRSSIRPFLPDGTPMCRFDICVLTAPVYKPDTDYEITIYHHSQETFDYRRIQADDKGKLKITVSGGLHDISITRAGEKKVRPVIQVMHSDSHGVLPGKLNTLKIQWLNTGLQDLTGARVEVTSFSEQVDIVSYEEEITLPATNDIHPTETLLIFKILDPDLPVARFEAILTGENDLQWNRTFTVPVLSDQKMEHPYEIVDGREMTYLAHGKDTVTTLLGKGNGDGKPDPGETFLVLVKDEGIFRLTNLSSVSPYLNLEQPASRQSDRWSPFDHVGASFKYSTPTISTDITADSELKISVTWWIPEYPDHFIKKGTITIPVSGKDTTAPFADHIRVNEDNMVTLIPVDGGKIENAKVRLISKDQPDLVVEDQLNDNGMDGDRIRGDHVFSKKVEVPIFGSYIVEIKMMDEYDNVQVTRTPDPFIFYGRKLYHD